MRSDTSNHTLQSFEGTYTDTEIAIGLVGAVGTPHKHVVEILSERLKAFKYETSEIRVSRDVIHKLYSDIPDDFTSEFERINMYIEKGNGARRDSGDTNKSIIY